MTNSLSSYLSLFLSDKSIFKVCICILYIVVVNACTTDVEDSKVLEAAHKYAQQNTDIEVDLEVESVSDNYARVKVTPKTPGTADDALMYLKKEKNNWRGIVIGTGFSPEDYKALKIPEEIQ
jgi:hypothetical protein